LQRSRIETHRRHGSQDALKARLVFSALAPELFTAELAAVAPLKKIYVLTATIYFRFLLNQENHTDYDT
jgi:hypothetical protein